MGIGAKIATVLAAGLVATGVAREAVEAVQASNTSAPSRPAAMQDNPAFSSVSAITHGRVGAGPISTRSKKSSRKAARCEQPLPGRVEVDARHRGRQARHDPDWQRAERELGDRPGRPAAPIVTPPAIQVPQTPPVPVQLPPVQVPPVQVPPLPVPPVPPPPLPLPPPPPLP